MIRGGKINLLNLSWLLDGTGHGLLGKFAIWCFYFLFGKHWSFNLDDQNDLVH